MTEIVNETKRKRHSLDVSYAASDGIAVIRLAGDLVGSEVVHFRRACTAAAKEGLSDRVVDLAEVESIDGYGLASLVGLLARRSHQGGRVVLCGINPELRSKFEATHCDVIFDTAFTVAKALDFIREGAKE